MSELYRPAILDHFRNPRHHGTLNPFDVSHQGDNPLCGDRIRIDLRFDGDSIADIRFSGEGCAISQAAASMLSELVIGQSIYRVQTLTDDDLLAVLDVPLTTARQQCATLGLSVLRACIKSPTPATL